MTKDFVLDVVKVLMAILAVIATISPLIFREGGIIWGKITRKGILVMSTCFGILLLLGCTAIWIHDPSQSLTALVCGGAGAIILVVYFAVMYIRLPRYSQKIDKILDERKKYRRQRHENSENSHQDEANSSK